MKRAWLVLAVVVSSALVGCGDDSSDTGGGAGSAGSAGSSSLEPKLSVIQAQIFDKNKRCTSSSCHGGAESPDLSAGKSYGQLVGKASNNIPGKMRVVAGKPEESLLYLALQGDVTEGGKTVGKMPQGGSLTAADIDLVKQWILAGAKDD